MSVNFFNLNEIHARKGTFKCVRCGRSKPWSEAVPTEHIPSLGFRYECEMCSENASYYDRNEEFIHTPKKHGFRFGCELECVATPSARAAVNAENYHLLATDDGSLPENGVEFKTGIIQSGCGFKAMMTSLDNLVDFKHPDCGQHINFSYDEWGPEAYRVIRSYAEKLFNPLRDFMVENPEKTERVCGRYFNHWCPYNGEYNDHYNWLNLGHNNRMEWRLAKVKTVNQYFYLINLCKEIVSCIDKNFLEYYFNFAGNEKIEHKAEITAKKIVHLFIKYENGDATCQRPERNSRER